MGSRKGTVDNFQPIRGIVTEASDTAFPQDAAYDLDNVEITKEGKTRRRLGLEQETGGTSLFSNFTEDNRSNGTYSTFLWSVVAGAETADVRIIQVANKLYVMEDLTPLSTQTILLEIDLLAAPYTTGEPINSPCQYADSAGLVLITNEACNPIVLRSTSATVLPLTLTAATIDLEIRTRTLLEPFTAGDDYGATLDELEEFNLRNSGWPFLATVALDSTGTGVTTRDPVREYRTVNGVYPTHSRLFNAMKLSSAEEVVAINSFSAVSDGKINFGNTVPPLGHFIHGAYYFDIRNLMQAEGIPISSGNFVQSSNNRPISCAFLNGHAIYGDIDADNKTRIMVSQLTQEIENLGKCYQEADPTSEEINDLTATDGFVVRPAGMGKPLAMRETSKGVVILCSNGVWAMRGTAGAFSATDFAINKLAKLDFTSPNSVIVVDDVVFFCAAKGIYSVTKNDFGELAVTNLTDETIKTLYQDYGPDRIRNIAAAYVQDENYIYWLVPKAPVAGNYKGDAYELLVLNLELGGFFQYSFGEADDRPALHIPMSLTNTTQTDTDEAVTISGGSEAVFTLGGDPVTSGVTSTSRSKGSLAFVATYRSGSTLNNLVATLTSTTMKDWDALGSPYTFAYTSFIEFAYIAPESYIGGVSAPYIHSFFEQGRQT